VSALKPCPFCGNGDAPFAITEDQTWIECGDCPANVIVGPFGTEAEAIAAWNTRSPLIAAAPCLLHAAERALNFIENTESELGIELESGDLLRAAIRRARGEAQ